MTKAIDFWFAVEIFFLPLHSTYSLSMSEEAHNMTKARLCLGCVFATCPPRWMTGACVAWWCSTCRRKRACANPASCATCPASPTESAPQRCARRHFFRTPVWCPRREIITAYDWPLTVIISLRVSSSFLCCPQCFGSVGSVCRFLGLKVPVPDPSINKPKN